MTTFKHEDDGKKGRFVLYDDGTFAGEITYDWSGDHQITVDHTGVEKEFGGKGYGKMLVMQAVAFAREKKLKIVPVCPFAQKVLERDKSLKDVWR